MLARGFAASGSHSFSVNGLSAEARQWLDSQEGRQKAKTCMPISDAPVVLSGLTIEENETLATVCWPVDKVLRQQSMQGIPDGVKCNLSKW